jgi:hypothetical protein
MTTIELSLPHSHEGGGPGLQARRSWLWVPAFARTRDGLEAG